MADTKETAFTLEDLSNFWEDSQKAPVVTIEEDTPEEVVVEDTADKPEDEEEESSEEQEEEQDEEEQEEELTEDQLKYQDSLHKGIAQAIAKTLKFDLNPDAIKDLDSLLDFVEVISQEHAKSEYETRKNSDFRASKILDIIENKGDTTEIIKLFEKEKQLLDYDLTSKEDQKAAIKRYYKSLNWGDEKISKYMDKITAEEELASEATDCVDRMVKDVQQEQEKEAETQKKKAEQEKARQQMRVKGVADYLASQKIPQKEAKELLEFAFKENYKINNEILSEMEVKILEKQSKPESLIDFVSYLKDPEAFIEAKIAQKTSKKTDSDFKKTVLSNLNKKVGGTSAPAKSGSVQGFSLDDFKL